MNIFQFMIINTRIFIIIVATAGEVVIKNLIILPGDIEAYFLLE